MSTAIAAAKTGDLTEAVREVFAQVTRYPIEILEPGASLEEDLGIDSVKVGEVFGVLREQYKLSDKLKFRARISATSGPSRRVCGRIWRRTGHWWRRPRSQIGLPRQRICNRECAAYLPKSPDTPLIFLNPTPVWKKISEWIP